MMHVAPHRQTGPARYGKPLQAEHPPRPVPVKPLHSRLDWWMVASAGVCILSALAVVGFVLYVLLFKVGL